jgi:nucleotide-binding universal stress UspA family protein
VFDLVGGRDDRDVTRIVVGVDGSSEARAALEWAVEEARVRGAELDAVHVWTYPPLTYMTGLVPARVFPRDELAAAARELLDAACDAVDVHGVRLDRILEEGPPAAQLVEAAKGADLLVVGSRGHGGFAGLLLGSVSSYCVHHAPCPVVVVPGAFDGHRMSMTSAVESAGDPRG